MTLFCWGSGEVHEDACTDRASKAWAFEQLDMGCTSKTKYAVHFYEK